MKKMLALMASAMLSVAVFAAPTAGPEIKPVEDHEIVISVVAGGFNLPVEANAILVRPDGTVALVVVPAKESK